MNNEYCTPTTSSADAQRPLSFRVIALDLDGTLTNRDKEVTPRTRQALADAQRRGATIILASGRPTYGIMPVAKCLDLEHTGGYILAYNGGKIVDCRTQEVLYERHLPNEVIPLIYQYAVRTGHALLGYVGNEIITEKPHDKYVGEESRINKMAIRKVDNLLEHLEPHPTKLLMTGHPADMERAEQELSQLLADRMDVYRSAPFFIELVPKGIDRPNRCADC